MFWLIEEGRPEGEFNASCKARNDIEEIALQSGFEKITVPTKYGVQTNPLLKPRQWKIYASNKKVWVDFLNTLNPGDVILVQYPLLNTTTAFDDVLKKARQKGIKTIAIIHDLDSLRYEKPAQSARLVERVTREDHEYLKQFDVVIAHNPVMQKTIKEWGIENSVSLGIFDYLLDNLNEQERTLEDRICIAGNLNSSKAGYLKELRNLPDQFELYGIGWSEPEAENISYHGAFPPEELCSVLNASFGLVWDGTSLDSCDGAFGKYTTYNNPHKTSMYLASGLPVVIWKQAALADFVRNNNVGICVDSLKDINRRISEMTQEDYNEMHNNVLQLQTKLVNGQFAKEALKNALNRIDSERTNRS